MAETIRDSGRVEPTLGSSKRATHADWRLPESESKSGTILSFFRRKPKPTAAETARPEPQISRREKAPVAPKLERAAPPPKSKPVRRAEPTPDSPRPKS